MIRAVIVGDDRVLAMLGQVHPEVMQRLEKSVRRLVMQLTSNIKGGKLSGQVLRTRTGKLRRSINPRVEVTDTAVIGSAGTNVIYGRVHEYGGTINIREHLRRVKKAFGRELKSPVMATVRAHTAKYPERSFLRAALKDMESEIKQELAEAVHGLGGRR